MSAVLRSTLLVLLAGMLLLPASAFAGAIFSPSTNLGSGGGNPAVGQACQTKWGCPPPLQCQAGRCVTITGAGGSGSGGVNVAFLEKYGESIRYIINVILVPLLLAVAFITFLWGMFRYFIWGAESEEDRATGRQVMLWGVVGFVAIVGVWGLVYLVLGTFGLSPGGAAPRYPTL